MAIKWFFYGAGLAASTVFVPVWAYALLAGYGAYRAYRVLAS